MKTVFVLFYNGYSREFVGVFSTREIAEERIKGFVKHEQSALEIEERELDE